MQKRILVVDDDKMNLMRTKMILDKSYEIVLAESGRKRLISLSVKRWIWYSSILQCRVWTVSRLLNT